MPLMTAPTSGIKVRMYRHGHGDCFLLAVRSSTARNAKPVYVLIDCGLKPKSEVKSGQTIDKIIKDIGESTGNRLDVVIITHEHQDHVNGFLKKKSRGRSRLFDDIEVGKIWLAWTEDGSDRFANALRERFNDTLIGLVHADQSLALSGLSESSHKRETLRDLLAFETGDEDAGDSLRKTINDLRAEQPGLSLRERSALAIKGITNKRAMEYIRDKASGKPLFLRPDRGPYHIPGVKGVRVYALGPPRNVEQLLSLDPIGDEEFHLSGRDPSAALAACSLDGPSRAFFSAVGKEDEEGSSGPFSSRYVIPANHVLDAASAGYYDARQKLLDYYIDNYGPDNGATPNSWRRIDQDWLGSSDGLALRLNNEVNNTSLVIAIELPKTNKVLLFTGDAQRGSWISWADLSWRDEDGGRVTARQLLERTVLYKVGHHGSHNATLDGDRDSDHANLSWMGRGVFGDEFVAMIPANETWARGKKKPWRHPLKAIARALMEKAEGRVFQSDIDKRVRPSSVSAADWKRFKSKTRETNLYFEYTVTDR